jgi:hypothetical protein
MSVFRLQNRTHCTGVTEAHPDKSFGEVSKLVSDRWKSLTDEQKLRFEDLARTDKERYHQEVSGHDCLSASY